MYSIEEIAKLLGVKQKPAVPAQISFLLTDSRKLDNPSQTLFFAFASKSNDGHAFVADLYARGVRNFVVSHTEEAYSACADANFLIVKSPLRALQQLAAHHRDRFNIPVIGITGSNGKTIVKEWLYQLLSPDFGIVRSPRSYNSQIGVPLSVWQLDEQAQLAIFEAGISQPQEMEQLERIIKPTIGILTKIGEAHHENFASLQQKCLEKMELFASCDVVIYEEDNPIIEECADMSLLSQKSFAWSKKNTNAPLFIQKISKETHQTVINYTFLQMDYAITIPFIDDASVENAISCLAILLFLHVSPTDIAQRMTKLEPVAMRMDVRKGKRGCLIINDAYNSDINSIKIALDFQKQRRSDNPLTRTLILSDVLQTGLMPKALYRKVSELINQSQIDRLVGIGTDISANADSFSISQKHFFKSTNEFVQSELWHSFSNELILLKGARQFNFERISALLEDRVHETVLEVNLNAIVHNFNFYKSHLAPGVKMVCMVKANAYGAGAVEIAKTLQYHRCDYLAVAVPEEGEELRQNGVSLPIIVLNAEVNGFEDLYLNDLEPEIYNFRMLNAFIREADRRGITNFPVHIKIDTGMHRLGFVEDEVPQVIDILKAQKGLMVKSVFSHLAASESWAFDDFSNTQIDTLNRIAEQIKQGMGYHLMKHVLNSAGIERFDTHHWDMTRLGIGLYGISASGLSGLQNVCTLRTTILQIKNVPQGETVGYGRKGTLDKPTRVATIRIGYADGLDRKFGNRHGWVTVNGQKAPIIGNVCMDLCMIDITNIQCQEGDSVIIFGDSPTVIELAESIQTIPYEILTSISPRVKRIFVSE